MNESASVDIDMSYQGSEYNFVLVFCLLLSSANNICKQLEPRQGSTFYRASSGYKLYDTLIVLLEEFFEKVNFEKNQ